ncbi:MAG: response regulator [Acidobacteriaceae bacterium]
MPVLTLCTIVRRMETGPTPHRILIIDDDAISLAVAAVLLESEGCTVDQAESGEQALEMLTGSAGSDAPDCILADLLMPSLAGPELAARLRPLAPRALFLAMSATPPSAVEGYDRLLRKPLSPETLRETLALIPPSAASAAGTVDMDAPAAEGSDSEVLDSSVFQRLRRAMSRDGLLEVISAFLEDTAARIAAMRTAEGEPVKRQAHTIKGSAGMLGLPQVAAHAAAIEAGIDHHGDRQRKLDALEVSVRSAEVILKQRLKI